MASELTPGATKKDLWFCYPETIRVAMDKNHLLYDPRVLEPFDEAFLADIGGDDGIHTPVRVCFMDGEYWLVFGRKRLLGLCEVNRRRKASGLEPRRIPCVTVKADDKTLYGMLISENEHRAEDSMLGRASKAVKYMELGASAKECAVKFGKTPAWVQQMVLLHTAPPQVQAAVTAGQIPASMAAEIAKMPTREDQLAALPKHVEDYAAGRTNVKDVQRQVTNKARAASGREELSPLPGRRVWARLVEMVNKDEIALAKPASKGVAEVKGIDHTVLQMAKVLAGQANIKSIPGLTAALRKAGFEVER